MTVTYAEFPLGPSANAAKLNLRTDSHRAKHGAVSGETPRPVRRFQYRQKMHPGANLVIPLFSGNSLNPDLLQSESKPSRIPRET